MADRLSASYTSNALGLPVTAASNVVIMPTAADAQTALAAVSATGYDTRCVQKTFDDLVQRSDASTNAQTDCGLNMTGSTISAAPGGQLESGQVGYSYSANVTQESGASFAFDIVQVSQVVGAVFVQVTMVGTNNIGQASGLTGLLAQKARADWPSS